MAGLCAVPALTPAQPAGADAVKRGEYLASAGDCVSCHTAKGAAPYAGGLRIDTPFGFLLSPNITPDDDSGIGRWSADDFWRALHDGVNRRGQDMYPAMPYTFYTKVSRADSDAIFAWLRTLPPVVNEVDADQLRFPFNQRWSMAVWRELYFTSGTFEPDSTKSAQWNRGAYLVEGLGHCSACHSPRNLLGAVERDRAFTGATIDGWFALNLTGNLHTGLGTWSVDELATYLKTGTAKNRTTAFGPMAEVVHNSTSRLGDADLRAMAEYLKSLPPDSSLVATPPARAGWRADGARVYAEYCIGCHQASGRGMPGVFPPLAGNGAVLAPDAADVLKVVLGGIPAQGRYVPMPAFGPLLSDQQIADVANYVRSSWGNTAPADATAHAVAALRRTMPAAKP
jgi:mono/diheme cytochrome c family protein